MFIYGADGIINTDNATLKVTPTGKILAYVGTASPVKMVIAECSCQEVASMMVAQIWNNLVAGKKFYDPSEEWEV